MLAIASLALASCNSMPFSGATASCQLIDPESNLTQGCPKELAPPAPDSKGGTILLKMQEVQATYEDCRTRYDGLISWVKNAVSRCQKLESKTKPPK